MKKSKIIIPAIALLALGVVGATTSTLAWYSSQANVSANYSNAYIEAPSNLLEVGAWNPYGATNTLEGGSSAMTFATRVDLTEVMSTAAAGGGSATASTAAPAGQQGKFFTKYGLGNDGQVTPGTDNNYNVTMNPRVVQAATDSAVADWGTSSTKAVGDQLNLMSAKAGRAYIRFGFSLRNVSASAIAVTVKNSDFTVVHNDSTETNSAYCFVAPSANGTAEETLDNIPVGTAKLETNASTTAQVIPLGLTVENIPAAAYVYYVATIWVDGSLFSNNAAYNGATFGINLSFTGNAV